MVKKKVGGGKRYKAVADAKAQGLSEPKWNGPAPALHVQKKLSRKVQFLEKVSSRSKLLSTTKLGGINKVSSRKKALPDLSTLGDVLDEVSKCTARPDNQKGDSQKKQRGSAVGTLKQRQHILVDESQRIQQVLQHPLYKKDPIAAITNHLQHTLPPVPSKPPQAKVTGKQKSKHRNKNNGSKQSDAAMMD